MNVSKQNFTTKKTNVTSTDDDGISMYLSFESTMNSDSGITYKTIANDCESSSLTDLVDSKGNSTLEAHKVELSGIMKDCAMESTSNEYSALRLKPVHAFKCLSAVSSTPSKIESPTRVKRCSFGQEHKSIERRQKDLSAVFNNLVAEFEQETKENVQPNPSEDSMPSFSKSSIILLQKIKNEVPVALKQVLSPYQGSAKQSLKVINEEVKENEEVKISPKKQLEHCQTEIIKPSNSMNVNLKPSALKQQKQNKPINISSKKELGCLPAGTEKTLEVINENTEPTTSIMLASNSKVKMNSAVRKTMCEPNLQTNRPSRIKATVRKGRASLNQAPSMRDFKSASGSMSEGPDLNLQKAERLVKPNENDKPKVAAVSRKSTMSTNKLTGGGRKSIAATLQNEKRPTPRRMPALVKTTFNSSVTRKVSRPSLAVSNAPNPKRRSVLLLQSKISQSPLTKRKKLSGSESSSNDRMNSRFAGGGDLMSNSPRKRTVTVRKTMYIEKPDAVKFACTECGASYHVKALLDSHKKTHRSTSPDAAKKVQRATGGTTLNNGNSLTTNLSNQCKFCDKVFMLERTLHIHLLEHCTKIPAAERRKLDFTEMDHVKKEETPHFRAVQVRSFKKFTPSVNAKDPLANFPIGNSNEIMKLGSNTRTAAGVDKKNDDETKKIVRNISPSRHTANKQTLMAPPGSTKVKKNTAHTGIYRTPNKDIPCVSCKQSFKNVLEFTNHMLAHATLDDCINSLSGQVE